VILSVPMRLIRYHDQWDPETPAVIAWIESSLGPDAHVLSVKAMPPSATAKHLVEVVLGDGATMRLVLRRYHDAKRLANDPWYVPAHEGLALKLLESTLVPAPHLYATDFDRVVSDVPALLESWLPGDPEWHPDDVDRYLARAAEVLVAIHAVRVPPKTRLPAYAPYSERKRLVSPSFSTHPGMWERVATILDSRAPVHKPTFIHRDYHPGNVLWDGAQVTGVVDWATAAWGPPGIDLARMRQNLAAHLGENTADRFAAAYVAAGGDPSARDPYWDLLDATDSLLDLKSAIGPGSGDFARFERYVQNVIAQC
jgi:aminoglycoside phosphotransferase (APT) family kinase protein